MILTGFLGVLAGALLWMDRVFVFQFMISRPMIMGPLIGLVMHDLHAGLLVGLSLELLWLNAPPVGAYLPNDESFCTAVGVPAAVLAGSWASPSQAAGLAILLCLPAALVGRTLDMRLRTMNEELLDVNERMSEKKISQAMVKAVLRSFILALVTLCACVMIADVMVIHVGKILPDAVLASLPVVPFACVLIGLAALVSREMPRRSHVGMFALGLSLVLLLTWIV